MDLRQFLTCDRGKEIPAELKDFNWGAFLLTFIWGIRFKAWVTLLGIPLIFIQMPLCLNWILFVVLQFYCGFNGNKWAYQVEYWKNHSEFRKTQTRWAIGAIAANIIVPVAIISLILQFIRKSPDNLTQITQNAQCAISYQTLKKDLPKLTMTPTSTAEELAKRFAARHSGSKVDGNSVIVKIKDMEFNINFIKNNENTCNTGFQNCSITAAYNLPIGSLGFQTCTFYFDQTKRLVPDEQTQKAIDKGLNIFKYL